MSVCLKDTKKKKKEDRPVKPIKRVPPPEKDDKNKLVKDNKNLTPDQVEALQDGEPAAMAAQQLNPMIIPDFFNNIRNNYYVANKIIWLTSFIEWPLITEVMRRLNFYDDGSKEPITLYLASPGGECDAGWALIDLMEKIKKHGTPIRTICAGSCSSMAAVILAAGSVGERYAFPSSRIMIHQAGVELTGGKLDDIANTTRELQYWTDTTAKYLSKVTKKPVKDIEKELCYDNYMSPTEAKKFGIIDKVDVFMA
ncbi:MAG: ATP-dependent Clp protease proteolytic subunit [Clostridia bacterium]|jgi:ATP-dependent Clp protease protease subunit|nr:ATP-dependent Clp protease proteolytic subunit [Clostridia bacterium]